MNKVFTDYRRRRGNYNLKATERSLYSLCRSRVRDGLVPISKILPEVHEQIQIAVNMRGITGLTTGLHDLDHAIMGLNNSDLILIASRPGMGKTSLALNIALNATKASQKTVAFFSLEMSCEQLTVRLLSSESCIDSKKLHTGRRLKPEEWCSLAEATKSLSATNILINDDESVAVSDMNAQCRRIPNLGLVIIDYIQLVQSASSSGRHGSKNKSRVVSEISRKMKSMAKELNVPIICLSQLPHTIDSRQHKKPMLSDFRNYGSIEKYFDIIIGLYRDFYYNTECENPDIAECIILKNRRGETGTVELKWQPEYTTFSSLEKIL